MLTSPRTVREISRSSLLAEQGPVIAFPNRPLERSRERLTLRHAWRPRTSFLLGWAFSSLGICLRRKSPTAARIAAPVIIMCALPGFACAQQDATWVGSATPDWNISTNWTPNSVPTGTATFNASAFQTVAIPGGATIGALQFEAPNYTFDIPDGTLAITGSGINATAGNPTFDVIGGSTPVMDFRNTSTAGTAQIIAGNPVTVNNGFDGGFIMFHQSSTAGQATITARDASNIEFHDASMAGTATLTAAPGGSTFSTRRAPPITPRLLLKAADNWFFQRRVPRRDVHGWRRHHHQQWDD